MNSLELNLPVCPEIELEGMDGNAFIVIAKCQKALRRAMTAEGYSNEEIKEYSKTLVDAMTEGDYDHLLQVVFANFDC